MSDFPDQIPPNEKFLPPHVQKGRETLPATYAEIPAYGSPDPGIEPPAGGLSEYWQVLRRRKGVLVLIASVGALIGFLVTLPQTPVYQASTTIEILGINQDFLNVRASSPVTESSNGYDTVDIPTQVRILQSGSLLNRVQEKVMEKIPATIASGRVSTWRTVLNLPELEASDARTQAISKAVSSLRVRPVGQTRIIEITADSTIPEVAADFANTLTSEFVDQTLQSRVAMSDKTGEFLGRQIEDIRARLEQSEERLQHYASQAGLVFTDEKTNVSSEKLSQVQESLSAAQADRILKQSRWEVASTSPPDALADVLNDANLREYETKLTELKRQLAELRQTYTDEAGQVRRVLAQVGPVQDAITRAKEDILKRIKNEYEEALRREKLLETGYADQRTVLTGEGEKSVQYSILKREVDSNRQLYDAMLQQMKQASLASALKASNMRVVDVAGVPGRPYLPDVPRSTGMGALGGLLLGVVFVIGSERTNRSIRGPGETSLYVNIPELGVIPQDASGSKVRLRVRGAVGSRLSDSAANGLLPGVRSAFERTELATLQRKPSQIAESFRATLVSILFSATSGRRPRVMVVTSSSPSEGKSTVVSNLGIAVAEVNQRVLLIDADLRRPRLHEIFSLRNDCGLADALLSPDPSPELPPGVVQETQIPGLFVMTAGSSSSAATSLLYSSRMPDLLRKLRMEFETIFVDTPPMLQIPDARLLARMVDGVILVVRSGKTTRDAIRAAHQRFSEDGTHVMGTVLNDWNSKHSADHYGHYGHYGKSDYFNDMDSGRKS